DTVDLYLLPGVIDYLSGCENRCITDRRSLTQTRIDVASIRPAETSAVHVARAAPHNDSGHHVLTDRLIHEVLWRDEPDLPGSDIFGARSSLDSTEMIDVAVGENDRDQRALTQGAIHERQGAGGCLYGSEWVNQDTAAIALDYAHVRQVIAANLIDTVGNFEEAVIVVEL